MFRGFDDRVETSAPVPDVVPSVHQMPNWTVEQIASVFNQLVPSAPQIVSAGLDAQGYSPQQRRLQKDLEGKRPPPAVGAGPIAVVPSLIYESMWSMAIDCSDARINVCLVTTDDASYSHTLGLFPARPVFPSL